ncbi:MAG TPA: dephospho-CoA kinase [Gammaproteobacteria bacterium]|nr:dephospho-CoA kinase [Gammaproteobacteria bacterium]
MLRVGLTGGIASGKSLVAAEFALLGVPVADADALSRELTAPGEPGLKGLVAVLGTDILDAHGHLDRGALRRRVFSDPALRSKVDGVLHPLILEALKDRLAAIRAPYALVVIPLLTEVPATRDLVDRVLVVDCPEELQVNRLMSRDGETEAQARAILSAQAPRAARLKAASDILLNAGDKTVLTGAVARLNGFYLELAAQGDLQRTGLRLP